MRRGARVHFSRGKRFRAGSLRLGAVAFLAAGRAAAAPLAFSLTWDAPPGCPDSDYLRAQVETLLTGAPPSLVAVAARAKVSQRADGIWTVKLTTDRDGAVGERSLEADACRSLADATALVVALTIDPAHVAIAGLERSDSPPDASAPVPQAPLPPTSALPPLPAPPPAPMVHPAVALRSADRPMARESTRLPLRFALIPAIAGDLGTLPHIAYGFTLAGSVLVGRFRGEAYGSYWPSQTAAGPVGTPPGEGGSIELFDGGTRACFSVTDERPPAHRLELSPCAGFEAGALHGKGVNLAPSLTATGLWLALTLDARAVVRLSRSLGVALDLGAAVPLRRDAFTFGAGSGAPVFHQAYFIEGRAWLGPELRF
jgi:hypothetical protein